MKKYIIKQTEWSVDNILVMTNTLYENGYSGLDTLDIIAISNNTRLNYISNGTSTLNDTTTNK